MDMHMQYVHGIFVLPINLILLVKQTQLATFELYRMQYCMFILHKCVFSTDGSRERKENRK